MSIIESTDLHLLLEALASHGYRLIGPTVRSGAVVLDVIGTDADLPRGWGDEQEPSRYELVQRNDGRYFGYTVGPHSWKRFLAPPRLTLVRATRAGKGFTLAPPASGDRPKMAFVGVRPCELSAILVQDKVFLGGPYVDRAYAAAREGLFILAVNCTRSAETCFCASMGTGPGAAGGFDIALTEILEGERHYFVAAAGSSAGEDILSAVAHGKAAEADLAREREAIAHAAKEQIRRMDVRDLPRVLKDNFEHSRWDDVAKRCLACTNCTMVCPTCFCSTVEDTTDLAGTTAERTRRWDSCFTAEFTRVAGGNIRPSIRARYRQWLTHKLSSWVDQFGTSGCVGCGRCITWCPSGIDITAEVDAIRGNGVHA